MAVWSEVDIRRARQAGRLDAEYFMPTLIALENRLSELGAVKLGDLCTATCSAFYPSATSLYESGDVPFLRCVDAINHPVLQPDQPYERLPREFIAANKSIRWLGPGDILVTKVGTPCYASLVGNQMPRVVMSRTVLGLRDIDTRKVDPRYLTAFLRSDVGFLQLMRERELTIQFQLTLDRTLSVKIHLPDRQLQQRIGAKYDEYVSQLERSKTAYTEAEAVLESALGLDKLDLKPRLFYERPYADVQIADRFDAEYFQPPKKEVLAALARMSGQPLRDQFCSIRQIWQPDQARVDEQVRNFDLTDALQPFLDETVEPTTRATISSAKKKLKPGDLVVSRLRSYLKEIAVVLNAGSVPMVGSTEFIVLRPQQEAVRVEALLVYLRSKYVQTVLKWCQDGSNHPRFQESELLNLRIPNAVRENQDEIVVKIEASIEARREARRLLEQAKAMVERAILGE